MATNFPGGLDAFGPVPKSQNVEVKHRVRHQNIEDAVEAVEAKVGVNNSADPTSLDYKVNTLLGPNGSSLIGFQQAGTGSVARTALAKMRDRVDARDFGVVADGVTNDTIALQNAINYCALNEIELNLPAGNMVVAGLTVTNGSALYMRGSEAGSQGSRLISNSNAPIIKFVGGAQQGTLENIGFIGQLDAAKPLQSGVYLEECQNVNIRNCIFDSLYDSIVLKDTVFFCQIETCRFFSVVRSQLRGTGSTNPGYAIRMSGCQISSPTANGDVLYFENAGSLVFSDVGISPATASGRCLRIVSNAPLSGIHQFDNCVFEGSVLEALRIEGTALRPIKYCYFSNCYFNQAGNPQDSVTLIYADSISFTNSYFSGFGSAMTFAGPARNISVVNADFPGGLTTAMFRTIVGGTINGLDLENLHYEGANRIFDSSATGAGSVVKISIRGGRIGTHASPILVAASDAAQVSCTTIGTTVTNNGGVASFNGGVSSFFIPHGLIGTPTKFQVVSNSMDAGNAEIREITVDAANIAVQCKAAAAGGTANVKWSWWAQT